METMHHRNSGRTEDRAQQLDLRPGTPMMVQFPESIVRHKGIYIGGEGQAYLVIRMLGPEDLDLADPRGAKAIGGCVHLGTVFAFETEVIEHIREPFSLVFLNYPEAVQTHCLRGSARVSSDIPARARVANRELRGRVVDLSTGGCRLAVRGRGCEPGVQPGIPIDLMFVLLGGCGEQTVRGHVRTCDLEAGRLYVGIQFDQADPAITENIKAYVLSVVAFDHEEAA
jgi:c-di-GMP-binding flagellar brake protein YcgR